MKKTCIKAVSLIICAVLFATCFYSTPGFSFNVNAASAQENQLRNDINKLQQEAAKIQNEINNLKKQSNNQAAVLAAVQKKIANTQAQINRCNSEINSINSAIAKNKAEIDAKNKEIESDKLEFKKRLRAIYMSNSDSNVKILLGAESFSDFLQLAQLTSSVSARDKAIMEEIKAAIDVLNKKNEENNKLLESQVSIRASIQEQQNQLKSEEAEAQKLYSSINSSKAQQDKDLASVNAAIKAKQQALQNMQQHLDNTTGFINPNTNLMWPVPYTRNIYSGWGYRSGGFHYGIDISAGGIYLKPVVAIADGEIYQSYNSCPHKSKTPICSCGSGFGNHLRIDHGWMNIKGQQQRIGAIYGHMDSIVVSSGKVKQGQLLGYVGTTGSSTGYHLHLTLLVGGKNTHSNAVNPTPYFFG